MVSPLRRSRTRLPATTVSTVTMSVPYPLSAARRTRSCAWARSLVTYSWNHSEPGAAPPAPARSSSIPVAAIVDSVYGSPCRSAARAAPISPSGCIIRVYPAGPSSSGTGSGEPSTGVVVSSVPTPASARGRNRHARNAASFARTAISSSAAPST